jgi:hypothetical protein
MHEIPAALAEGQDEIAAEIKALGLLESLKARDTNG